MTAPSRDDLRAPSETRAPSRMPGTIAPMRATAGDAPFDSPDHIFELLWGGVRAMAYVEDRVVRLRGCNGRDLTPYFPELTAIPDHVRAREAILDGEIVALDSEGHPSFDLLRPRLDLMWDALGFGEGTPTLPPELKIKRVPGQLTYQVSDIVWLDGRSLLDRPLWQRKNRLAESVASCDTCAAVDFVDHEGAAFFDAVIQRRLEGIVARQKVSTYRPGHASKDLVAIRALQSGDFVVGGYTIGGARRKGEPFSQLLVGGYTDGRFEFVGAVSGGMADAEARALTARLEPLLCEETPFFDTPHIPRLIYWTRPELVVHVRFSEWDRDGHLRFPIFSALRPDLAADECLLP